MRLCAVQNCWTLLQIPMLKPSGASRLRQVGQSDDANRRITRLAAGGPSDVALRTPELQEAIRDMAYEVLALRRP
ncbi:MAG: hypothetical protein JWP65_214 [Ramlibacter sp.]|nr:hypothetical protein [Ramlibacter sp.]